MRGLRACLWFSCAGLLGMKLAHADALPSVAQTPVADDGARNEARQRFAAASELAKRGDWALALAAYRESFELFPSAVTLFNLGYCHAQLGHWVSALRVTTAALEGTRFDADHRLTPERRLVAEAQLESVQAHVGMIAFSGAPVSRVVVDGVGATGLGGSDHGAYVVDPVVLPELTAESSAPANSHVQTVVMDPGQHRVTVTTALGEGSYDVVLASKDRKDLRVDPTLVPALSAPIQPAVAAPAAVAQGPNSTNWATTAGVGALVVGGVGFGLAAGFGVVARNADAELAEACGPELVCGPAQQDTVERYRQAVTWTNVGLVTGVIGTAAGLSLLLLIPAPKAGGTTAVSLSPSGAVLRRTF